MSGFDQVTAAVEEVAALAALDPEQFRMVVVMDILHGWFVVIPDDVGAGVVLGPILVIKPAHQASVLKNQAIARSQSQAW
jgi:hypothetical protein